MADKTGIQWTDATWNPIAGCSVVSPACTNCYAMAQAAALERRFGSEKYAGLTRIVNGKPVWTGEMRLHEPSLDQPLRWKRGRRIFVNSMSDLFHENLPDAAIDRIFAVMALAPQHAFLVLTKRPERMREYFSGGRALRSRWFQAADEMAADLPVKSWTSTHWDFDPEILPPFPLPNCWLGVTAEDQQRADERIPILLDTPAAKRFVSCEPLLGPVELTEWLQDGVPTREQIDDPQRGMHYLRHGAPRLDWVICGGESGPGARPMRPDWPRALRDQCATAGVPFFFKQWGEWIDADERASRGFYPRGTGPEGRLTYDEAAAIAREQRLRFEHLSDGRTVFRLGKHSAGRLLDGREWSEMPR